MADTALKDFPTLFDNVAMPFPNSWTENFDVVESVQTSEAGTDIVQVVRYDKLRISASYNCLSDQVKIFKGYSNQETIEVSVYDQIEEGYATHTMRMRDFSVSYVKDSQDFTVTKGIWKVSFSLLEI